MNESVKSFLARIGGCQICMRQAFLAAAAAWCVAIVAAVAAQAFTAPALIWLASGASVFLTLLWLTHLAVYAFRAVRRPSLAASDISGRRGLVFGFAAAFATAALASIASIGPAQAQSGSRRCITNYCGGSNEVVCCPQQAPYLSHCDCRCYADPNDMDCRSYSHCTGNCA